MIRLAVVQIGDLIDTYVAALPHLDGLAVTAVVENDLDRARFAAERLGAPIATDSVEDLLQQRHGALDAIVVYAPLNERTSAVQLAVGAGKHVLVAAPLAPTVEEADAINTACATAAVRLMVAPFCRFLPSSRTIQDRLAAGKFGKPGLVRLHHWFPRSTQPTSFVSQVTAEIDVVNWLLDGLPETIFAVGRTSTRTTLDDVQIHLGYATGAMALIDVAHGLPANSTPYYSLTLIGSTGAAYADDHRNVQLLYRGQVTSALKVDCASQVLRRQLGDFSEAIQSGQQPSSNGLTGRQAIEVAQGAAVSLRAGRSVRLAGEQYELV